MFYFAYDSVYFVLICLEINHFYCIAKPDYNVSSTKWKAVICHKCCSNILVYNLFYVKSFRFIDETLILYDFFWVKLSNYSNLVHSTHTYLPMKMEKSVPKRRHIKFRCQGITQKKSYNFQNTVKI